MLEGLDHDWAPAALLLVIAIWQSAVALLLRRRIARLAAAVGRRAAAVG
jgi:hypothetical protein